MTVHFFTPIMTSESDKQNKLKSHYFYESPAATIVFPTTENGRKNNIFTGDLAINRCERSQRRTGEIVNIYPQQDLNITNKQLN